MMLAEPSDLAGGSPEDNVKITYDLFAGRERGPKRDIVALNAGAGLVVAGVADGIADGVERAVAALEDGSAAAALESIST